MAYLIVYPKGDRTRLAVVYAGVVDYDDYDRASRRYFNSKSEAHEEARRLADEYGKMLDGEPEFLD